MVKMLREVYGPQFLLNALKDGDEDVRTDARKGLIEMGTAAVDPLIAALKSEDTDTIRKNIVEILGEIQDSRAIEPLIETLKSESPVVQKRAVKALKKITKQSVGDTYEAWFKWWQENKD
jgi:HEAT repeat protein